MSRVGFAKRIQPSDLAAGHLQGPVRTVTQVRTTSFPWSRYLSRPGGGAAEAAEAGAGDQPLSLDAAGTTDETALGGEVVPGDPDADELLDVPEVESDEMPDSDIEE